jgi:steroid delta-isomerase
MTYHPQLERLVRFYEGISPATVRQELSAIYAADAKFKDPFNEVQGLPAIAGIFEHMFKQVDQPMFVVVEQVLDGSQAFLTWDFHFRMKRFSQEPQLIRGATHIVFDGRGAVSVHRDYWDAAEELYEKLPVLGALMRWLKRAANR